jgi:hypothetical protein
MAILDGIQERYHPFHWNNLSKDWKRRYFKSAELNITAPNYNPAEVAVPPGSKILNIYAEIEMCPELCCNDMRPDLGLDEDTEIEDLDDNMPYPLLDPAGVIDRRPLLTKYYRGNAKLYSYYDLFTKVQDNNGGDWQLLQCVGAGTFGACSLWARLDKFNNIIDVSHSIN